VSEPTYSPAPEYDERKYQKAKASLGDPNLAPELRAGRMAKIADYEKSQAEYNQALSHHEYRSSAQVDPVKEELVKRIRQTTKDDTLNNASNLKVFGDPPEYEPPPKPSLDPIGGLGAAISSGGNNATSHWHEPTLEDFRGALREGGSLAARVSKELQHPYGVNGPEAEPASPNSHRTPKVKGIEDYGNKALDPSTLSDSELAGSDAFKAYRDAAWQAARANAIREGKPIYRLEFTSKLSPGEKAMSKALDAGGAAVSGLGQSATLGHLDPLQRAINPKLAESNRKQRLRNPTADTVGQLAGAAVGAPEMIARGSAKVLGGVLGESALGRLGASMGAGAITSGVDSQARSIAQAAADALDAGDSAVEAAKRLYGVIDPIETMKAALMGGGAGAVGHAIGGAMQKGARALAGGNAQEVLLRGEDAGLKMGPLGNVRVPKNISDRLSNAAAKGQEADIVLANELADPLASQRLLEQEAAHRGALEETARAREQMVEPAIINGSISMAPKAVGTADAARKILAIGGDISDLAGGGRSNEIRAIGRRLQARRQITPAQLDADIDEIERIAKSGKEPDKTYLAVKNVLLELRDEFHLPEDATAVDNFAIRDKSGKVKLVDGYSGIKKAEERAKAIYKTENASMGLPQELKGEPLRMAKAPDAESAQALAESLPPKAAFGPGERDVFVGRIASSVNPENAVRFEQFRDVAARGGGDSGEKLLALKQLRATRNWKQYLGRAVNGISGSGGTYLRANNLLRLVPAMKNLGGGLPKMEASRALEDVVDRFLDKSVPNWKAMNLQGGQPARFVGAATRHEKDTGDPLTEEESAVARAIIKRLLEDEFQRTGK
jgi:hypothetical protein